MEPDAPEPDRPGADPAEAEEQDWEDWESTESSDPEPEAAATESGPGGAAPTPADPQEQLQSALQRIAQWEAQLCARGAAGTQQLCGGPPGGGGGGAAAAEAPPWRAPVFPGMPVTATIDGRDVEGTVNRVNDRTGTADLDLDDGGLAKDVPWGQMHASAEGTQELMDVFARFVKACTSTQADFARPLDQELQRLRQAPAPAPLKKGDEARVYVPTGPRVVGTVVEVVGSSARIAFGGEERPLEKTFELEQLVQVSKVECNPGTAVAIIGGDGLVVTPELPKSMATNPSTYKVVIESMAAAAAAASNPSSPSPECRGRLNWRHGGGAVLEGPHQAALVCRTLAALRKVLDEHGAASMLDDPSMLVSALREADGGVTAAQLMLALQQLLTLWAVSCSAEWQVQREAAAAAAAVAATAAAGAGAPGGDAAAATAAAAAAAAAAEAKMPLDFSMLPATRQWLVAYGAYGPPNDRQEWHDHARGSYHSDEGGLLAAPGPPPAGAGGPAAAGQAPSGAGNRAGSSSSSSGSSSFGGRSSGGGGGPPAVPPPNTMLMCIRKLGGAFSVQAPGSPAKLTVVDATGGACIVCLNGRGEGVHTSLTRAPACSSGSSSGLFGNRSYQAAKHAAGVASATGELSGTGAMALSSMVGVQRSDLPRQQGPCLAAATLRVHKAMMPLADAVVAHIVKDAESAPPPAAAVGPRAAAMTWRKRTVEVSTAQQRLRLARQLTGAADGETCLNTGQLSNPFYANAELDAARHTANEGVMSTAALQEHMRNGARSARRLAPDTLHPLHVGLAPQPEVGSAGACWLLVAADKDLAWPAGADAAEVAQQLLAAPAGDERAALDALLEPSQLPSILAGFASRMPKKAPPSQDADTARRRPSARELVRPLVHVLLPADAWAQLSSGGETELAGLPGAAASATFRKLREEAQALRGNSAAEAQLLGLSEKLAKLLSSGEPHVTSAATLSLCALAKSTSARWRHEVRRQVLGDDLYKLSRAANNDTTAATAASAAAAAARRQRAAAGQATAEDKEVRAKQAESGRMGGRAHTPAGQIAGWVSRVGEAQLCMPPFGIGLRIGKTNVYSSAVAGSSAAAASSSAAAAGSSAATAGSSAAAAGSSTAAASRGAAPSPKDLELLESVVLGVWGPLAVPNLLGKYVSEAAVLRYAQDGAYRKLTERALECFVELKTSRGQVHALIPVLRDVLAALGRTSLLSEATQGSLTAAVSARMGSGEPPSNGTSKNAEDLRELVAMGDGTRHANAIEKMLPAGVYNALQQVLSAAGASDAPGLIEAVAGVTSAAAVKAQAALAAAAAAGVREAVERATVAAVEAARQEAGLAPAAPGAMAPAIPAAAAAMVPAPAAAAISPRRLRHPPPPRRHPRPRRRRGLRHRHQHQHQHRL